MLHRHPTAGLAVRCAIRFDVTVNTGQAANLPATCHLHPADNHAAILLAVCDQRHDIHSLAILDTVREALEAAGIPVMRRVMARDVTAAGRWIDPDSGEYGPTYPYTDSIVTAERVGQGDRASPTRADIVASRSAAAEQTLLNRSALAIDDSTHAIDALAEPRTSVASALVRPMRRATRAWQCAHLFLGNGISGVASVPVFAVAEDVAQVAPESPAQFSTGTDSSDVDDALYAADREVRHCGMRALN
jgi:hypothetical protein